MAKVWIFAIKSVSAVNQSMLELEDTIAAPITPPGKGGVSIVRLSGSQTPVVLRKLVKRAEEVLSHPRQLVLSELVAAEETLDIALCVYFAGRESFTGEATAEFHLHGSPFLVRRLLDYLTHFPGVRLAEPGEFSKRAFLNGKLDLSQAEAIADLINAETEAQSRLAREQLQGKLSRAVDSLGEPLRDILAELEAYIDFPEEDIEPQNIETWVASILRVRAQIGVFIESFNAGRIMREGLDVAIVGLPNAGKSSLLNQLVGEDRVIVSPIAGTTRDTIEEHISVNGQLLKLWDTAGITPNLSETRAVSTDELGADDLERLGVERSWRRLARADVALFVIDGSLGFHLQERLLGQVLEGVPQVVLVCNKLDLLEQCQIEQLHAFLLDQYQREPIFVSALTRVGIGQLREKLSELAGIDCQATSTADSTAKRSANGVTMSGERARGSVLLSSKRHVDALQQAEEVLLGVMQGLQDRLPPELVSIDLRRALSALGEIVGATHTEEILGRIFSRFCIGK